MGLAGLVTWVLVAQKLEDTPSPTPTHPEDVQLQETPGQATLRAVLMAKGASGAISRLATEC